MRSLIFGFAITAAACTLDVRDLDAFRETARGPEKLSALVRDRSRSPALRAEAALRLLDLERPGLDGQAMLLDDLRALGASERGALVPTLERGLLARMDTPVGATPDARAIRAKDLSVRLLPLFDDEARTPLGTSLVRWVGTDVERRADVGEFSLEAITAQVGNASAAPSAQSLRSSLRAKELARLTETVLRYGDKDTRAQAAAKMVEVERAYRAAPNKQAELTGYALPMLFKLVDTEVAQRRLVTIVADPRVSFEERERALEALQGHVGAADVSALAQVALDESAPMSLRSRALERLGETRAPDALKPLLTLVGSRTRALREAAFIRAIDVGGERAVSDVLNALPQHWTISYAKDEIERYAERLAQLPPTSYLVQTLGRKMYAYFWWQRVLGMRYVARRASVMEATWRLKLHVDDKKEITGDGWPGGYTVGREATNALNQVASRG